jgi:hypothetical protein
MKKNHNIIKIAGELRRDAEKAYQRPGLRVAKGPHRESLQRTIRSVQHDFQGLLMGIIGNHVDITSQR